MSNVSGSSTATSKARERVKVVGVPRRCWCGEVIVALNSHSDANPNRRYFRCRYAADLKLVNDKHCFKWVDEALLDEFQTLSTRIRELEGEVHECRTEHMSDGKAKELVESLEVNLSQAIYETECKMKKIIAIVVVCFLITIAILKIVGE